MCPVGALPLVDHALARFDGVGAALAVNVHHGRAQLEAHLDGRAHVSVEPDEALGTAGAVGHLRDWLAGRAVVVLNGDTWCPAPVHDLVAGWDGETVRVQVMGDEPFGPRSRVAGTLLPWSVASTLPDAPSGLWELVWRDALSAGRIETVAVPAGLPFFDCGTPASYLAANLHDSGGEPVIGRGAEVDGELVRSVVWPGAVVGQGERLVDAIRTDGRITVLVR
jgi:mannose-1-phosphate guanylyltransferase/MurNAc alpha-1-phosphate uridylyltransferase